MRIRLVCTVCRHRSLYHKQEWEKMVHAHVHVHTHTHTHTHTHIRLKLFSTEKFMVHRYNSHKCREFLCTVPKKLATLTLLYGSETWDTKGISPIKNLSSRGDILNRKSHNACWLITKEIKIF